MARRVFFSFHFARDIWRVNQVRNSWVAEGNRAAGFIDAAEFEVVRQKGTSAVHRWIDAQLRGTTVTVILIGRDTAERDYVQYEIERSIEKNNGLLPVFIHRLRDRLGDTDWCPGDNPLDEYKDEERSWLLWKATYADRYPAYDWVGDNGYLNFGTWVENAFQIARK